MDSKTRTFEDQREMLAGLAYRMLGSRAEAEDIVQETYLKWRHADAAEIRNPRAWLMTVTTRLALNGLASARKQRETYFGTWLPEPIAARAHQGPADSLEFDETVSIALMLALETLSPPERASYLLHDVFGYSFEEIGRILEASEASCRKLASRSRKHIRAGRSRFAPTAEDHRSLLTGFLHAARAGDVHTLEAMLAESAALYADGGGKAETISKVLHGPRPIARFLVNVWADLQRRGIATEIRTVWFNGSPGLAVIEDGKLTTALSAEVIDGRLHRIYAVRNPNKLAGLQAAGGLDRRAPREPA